MRWPSIQVGDQPCQSPVSARSRAAPSVRRRGTERISAMVISAVSSVSTPGVLVTIIERFRAVSRSILSTPVPNWAISLSSGPAWLSTVRSMRSVTVGTSTLAVFTASTSSSRENGLSSRLRRASNSSLSRVSTTSGSLRVTITSGRSEDITYPVRRLAAAEEDSSLAIARCLFCALCLTEGASRDKASYWLRARKAAEPRSFHFSRPLKERRFGGHYGGETLRYRVLIG